MTKYAITLAENIGIRPSVSPEIWLAADWQRLWRSLIGSSRTWRTLAVVPGGPAASPATVLQIASALAQTGASFLQAPVQVANATNLAPAQLPQFWREVHAHTRGAGLMIVAVSALVSNPASLQLAKEADGAMLCLLLGEMSTREARSTLKQVGVPQFLGSAVFHLPVTQTGSAARKV